MQVVRLRWFALALLVFPLVSPAETPHAIVTLLEGQAALFRGAARYALSEGVRLQSGDILEVAAGVTRLSRLADRLSQGEDIDAPDFEAKGSDEIAVLAQSFNRMKKSLVQAMRMIEAPARAT